MKFALASDLHLGFGGLILTNEEGADVLVLAGDTFEIANLPDIEYHYVTEFFRNVSNEFKHVFVVFGNHEHYGLSLGESYTRFKDWLALNQFDNIKLLNRDTVVVDGVSFHGTTLWTDVNRSNPISVSIVERGMHDYIYIKDWCVAEQVKVFDEDFAWIKQAVESNKNGKNVVVTHHHPSLLSIPERFRGDELSFGYASDLSEFILDSPQINYWCAGHTHDRFEYVLGETTVVCNPRGYKGYEKNASNFTLRYYDI